MAAAASTAWRAGSKIVAVAKNYAAHAKEMGVADVASLPKSPSFFLKPGSSIVREGAAIRLPRGVGETHHEVELGVVIDRTCSDVRREDAMSVVGGYCLGLDMTARQLQSAAKEKGQPWTRSKCYDTFTPLSDVIPSDRIPNPGDLTLYLAVDGVERQRGTTADMIFDVPTLIEEISNVMTLEAGDIILTGTPEGVGPVEAGQTITAGIEGHIEMTFPVEDK